MAGGRKYRPDQIRFALECILAGFSNKDAIGMFRHRFGNPDWGLSQLKYMRVTYGDHPDFGQVDYLHFFIVQLLFILEFWNEDVPK